MGFFKKEANVSLSTPLTWSAAELQALAHTVNEMIDKGCTHDAIQALHYVVSEAHQIAGHADPKLKKIFAAKQETQAISLIEGLRQTGLIDEKFLEIASQRVNAKSAFTYSEHAL
jgi:hypothetical protein